MMRVAVMALVLAGCTAPDVPACVARCQLDVKDAGVCRTMCTHSCAELHATFGVSEVKCRRMQDGVTVEGTTP